MEVNGDDHNPFKDCVEMLTVYASTLKDKGVRLRYWFVPYRNGDTSVNEIVRQHWLRHHVLSRTVPGSKFPKLQIFLVTCKPSYVSAVQSFLSKNLCSSADAFLEHNVHIITGCPAPVLTDNAVLLKYRNLASLALAENGEFSPIVTQWNYNVWDNKVGSSRSRGRQMLMPVSGPLKLIDGEVCLPLDYAPGDFLSSAVMEPVFRSGDLGSEYLK